MLRSNRMLRTRFGLHREQPKTNRRQETVKLQVEVLEDRTLLSVSAGNPLTNLSASSSPIVSAAAAVESSVRSTLDQWLATVQQEVMSFWTALGQEFAQRVSFVEQQLAPLFGFDPNAQNASPITPVSQQGSGSDSSSGSSTNHSAPVVVIPHAASPSSPMTTKASPLDVAPPVETVHLSSSFYSVNEDAGTVAVEVDCGPAPTSTVAVQLTTSDGTAKAGIDYDTVNTTVVFQPGQTSQIVNIPILDDGSSDDSAGSESFSVQLLGGSSGGIIVSSLSSTVTIQENPLPNVYLSSSSYSVNEAAGSVPVEVDLSAPSTNPVSVQLTTSNGTATSGVDYTSVDTTVDFQPGQTSEIVNVSILDDGASDDTATSESFSVQLSNASGAVVSPPSSAVVTIQENSSPPPPSGTIYGTEWLDSNDDGIMQATESGLSVFPVNLNVFTTNFTYSFQADPDGNGYYQFELPSNMIGYTYQISVPFNYTNYYGMYKPTIEDASSTGIVSNIDENGYSPVFALNANGEAEINAGFVAVPKSYLVTQPTDDGTGNTPNSLSWAIKQANANPGSEIDFNINNNTQGTKQTITVSGQEPAITAATTINGYSQSGQANGTVPWIELKGPGAGGKAFDGLDTTTGGILIKGLAIDNFNGDGIDLNDPGASVGNADNVQGCYIGTDLTGATVGIGNQFGVEINGSNNTIGGARTIYGNIISGNANDGIRISGAGAAGNIVQNNLIGIGTFGYSKLPNNRFGINIDNGAANNTIGGSNSDGDEGNIISGNGSNGINLISSNQNFIYGNNIGVYADGATIVGNAGDGIAVGGSTSGNYIGGRPGSGTANVISGNALDGIFYFSTGDNTDTIMGNYIGTNSTGTAAVPNEGNGINIGQSAGLTIENH